MAGGKILWHTTMSLDGFVAGPDDSMDWAYSEDVGASDVGSAVARTTGAIVAGRRWYDLGLTRPNWAPYGGAWHGPMFILTHRPPVEPAKIGVDLSVTFLTGNIGDAIAVARKAAAGKDVVIFGPTIARECIEAGVLDEILVHVVPVLVGTGIRFFDRPGIAELVRLRRTELGESGQLTDLRFEVLR
jgi:dihydrofolate reductase